ncbi:hypothetical protein [Mesorhizobium neociceri]|uniref:Uncharacterized protein n=1 Tax=Mesorhizobium neociceri TaxID=1307853 RepID=A0A838BGX3_9HYPH|nr:hypothetical protein [Mesorhizobium neociceri]MBA1145297.1 hypothetical protein [Mesorhizobium neociceri]
MQPSRLLYAIGFGCLAVPSQAEEISDAVVLYEKICIASDGDLMRSEQLALENGFSIWSNDFGVKTYNRDRSGNLSKPFVTLKSARTDGNSPAIDVCEVFGTTTRISDFDNYVRLQGLIEVPKEQIVDDVPDQTVVRLFVSKECEISVQNDGKCRFVGTISDQPPDGKLTGVFRFGTNSQHHQGTPE